MAKGNGTTRSVGSNSAAAPRTSGGGNLSKAQIEEKMGMSEQRFFNITGRKFGHPLSSYKEGLDIVNKLPDSATLFTGHSAGEAKESLRKLIKILGA